MLCRRFQGRVLSTASRIVLFNWIVSVARLRFIYLDEGSDLALLARLRHFVGGSSTEVLHL